MPKNLKRENFHVFSYWSSKSNEKSNIKYIYIFKHQWSTSATSPSYWLADQYDANSRDMTAL